MNMPVPSNYNPRSVAAHKGTGKIPERRMMLDKNDVFQALADYKAWSTNNPVKVGSKGKTAPAPMTFVGFSVFCGIPRSTLYGIEKSNGLQEAFQMVRDTFEADLVNQGLLRNYDGNIAARVAGLVDKQQVQNTDVPIAVDYDWSLLDDDEVETLKYLLTKASKNNA